MRVGEIEGLEQVCPAVESVMVRVGGEEGGEVGRELSGTQASQERETGYKISQQEDCRGDSNQRMSLETHTALKLSMNTQVEKECRQIATL